MPVVNERSVHGQVLLEPRDLEIVRAVLARVAPQRKVWVFGSRAHGRHVWRFSDLDLAIEGRLTSQERVELEDAFEESFLPVLVDVVELDTVDPEFAARIRPDFLAI